MNLIHVEHKRVAEIWPGVKHLIHKAMERGGLGSFEDVETELLKGNALLWLAWDGTQIYAAAITQTQKTEFAKVCVIAACGGNDSSKWLPLIGGIEKYAKAEGCNQVRIFGRKGWKAKLPDYHENKIILEKVLR